VSARLMLTHVCHAAVVMHLHSAETKVTETTASIRHFRISFSYCNV